LYTILRPSYEGNLVPPEIFDRLLINYATASGAQEYDLNYSQLNMRIPFIGIVPGHDDGLDIGEQLRLANFYLSIYICL